MQFYWRRELLFLNSDAKFHSSLKTFMCWLLDDSAFKSANDSTCVADHQIKKIEQGSYLPHGIISTNGETKLIQEGTDNVDINTKTIDGKDTFHSMARTVFQVQSSSDRPTIDPIKRSSDHSLHTTEASSNIIACLPFKKPKECVEPVL